jgi:septal ring factor EnvC (AmiA/AmiB activator)
MSRSNLTDILLLLVVGLLLYNVFTSNKIKTDVKSYKKEIKRLQTGIDSTKLVNIELDKKLTSVNTEVEKVTQDILVIDRNIKIIRRQTNEKVNSIDNISNVELEQFFTSRYNLHMPTK